MFSANPSIKVWMTLLDVCTLAFSRPTSYLAALFQRNLNIRFRLQSLELLVLLWLWLISKVHFAFIRVFPWHVQGRIILRPWQPVFLESIPLTKFSFLNLSSFHLQYCCSMFWDSFCIFLMLIVCFQSWDYSKNQYLFKLREF